MIADRPLKGFGLECKQLHLEMETRWQLTDASPTIFFFSTRLFKGQLD